MSDPEMFLLYNVKSKWFGVRCEQCKDNVLCDDMTVHLCKGGDTENGLIHCEVCGTVRRYFTPSSNRK